MSAIQLRLTTGDYTAPNFSWYEFYGSTTDWGTDADVLANAEWSDVAFATVAIHAALTAGETWYHWARALYDNGTTSTALFAFGATVAPDQIEDGTVTYAKIQDVSATNKVLGRSSAGAGTIEEISCTAAGRAMLAAVSAAAQKALLAIVAADISDASANGRSLITAANYAAMKTLLAVAAADITDATANGRSLITAANYAAMRTLLGAGAASGLATLDSGGLIPAAQLPPIAITDSFPVASQAAMLALTAEKGDVAIRSDVNKTFILSTNSPGTLADWLELQSPTGGVSSVAGKTGVVTLQIADITDVTANGQSLVKAANYAAMKVLLAIAAGDVSGLAAVATSGSQSDIALGSTATLASASTINLTTSPLKRQSITGAVTITGVTGNNVERILYIAGSSGAAPQFTHSSALVCPGGRNFQSGPGDVLNITTDGAGNATLAVLALGGAAQVSAPGATAITTSETNLTTVTLPGAGTWLVWGALFANFSNPANARFYGGISLNSGSSTGTVTGKNYFGFAVNTTVGIGAGVIPPFEITVTAATTIYLVAQTVSVNESQCYPSLQAKRVS